jgi:glycosyltransferase involved in cell wall biosynthesis
VTRFAAPDPHVAIVAPSGLHDSAGIGGLVRTVTRLWQERGTPHFVVVDPYGRGRRLLVPFHLLGALGRIVWLAWRGRVTIVHVHMSVGGSVLRKSVVARLAQRLGLPVILHLHGWQFDAFFQKLPAFLREGIRSTMRRADALIVLGETWRGRTAAELGIDPESIQVLYNTADSSPAPAARDGNGPCRIVFLGRLETAKGASNLIDALLDERLREPAWTARLAGAGDAQAYRDRVRAAGLEDRIEIRGWSPRPVVQRWMMESDIFVLPSHAEGMSVAVLEAMASGLAVITTPVGAHAEAVIDGVSGILVPVGSHDDLVAALARLIRDVPYRRQLQAGARKRFEECFAAEDHDRRLLRVYETVLQRRRGAVAQGRH